LSNSLVTAALAAATDDRRIQAIIGGRDKPGHDGFWVCFDLEEET
jgi:hypothetical protein